MPSIVVTALVFWSKIEERQLLPKATLEASLDLQRAFRPAPRAGTCPGRARESPRPDAHP